MADLQTTEEIRAELAKSLREQLPAGVRECFDELISNLDDELRETRETWQNGADEDADTIAELTDALEAVREWMHDVMFLQKGMSDPRRILRIVERAIDP